MSEAYALVGSVYDSSEVSAEDAGSPSEVDGDASVNGYAWE